MCDIFIFEWFNGIVTLLLWSVLLKKVLFCSPEGFDFSHICLYVCVYVFSCDWLLWSPHSRFAMVALFAWEGCLFFSGKRSFRYKKYHIFAIFYQFFLQFDPLVCSNENVCVGEANNLFVTVWVCCQKHIRKTRFACLYWYVCEEVRIQELGCVSVYWWEDHVCFACCVLLSSILCKCVCVGCWYMFYFFLGFSSSI